MTSLNESEPGPVPTAPSSGRLVIAHETDGRKYYQVLIDIAAADGLQLAFFETMIERELARRALHHRRPPAGMAAFWWRNWRFRLAVPRRRDEVVVLGMGPWDPRMLWYGRLARRNRVIYSASWPDWTGGPVPRDFGPLNGALARAWGRVFAEPGAEIVAVTPGVAASLAARFPHARITVIPHVAHRAFFAHRRGVVSPSDQPLRVAQVGELSAKKGVPRLPEILARVGDRPIEVSLIGDGPLAGEAAAMGREWPIRTLGHVADRDRLAQLVAAHDVLLVPSQRTRGWEELFGMVIVEAQAAGVVPVASAHVGPRQLITDGHDGFLLDEDDVDGFAERLRRLDGDRTRLAAMRAAAVRAAEPYHPDAIAERWRAVLAGVHARPARADAVAAAVPA
jgi:glycosyltransferase involved in cell wall biosynthesis